METYKPSARDIFSSTKQGRIISIFEGAICGALFSFITFIPVIFIVPHPSMFMFWVGLILGSLLGAGIAQHTGKSLILWRLFDIPVALIDEYRGKEIIRLNKRIEENVETIERLEKENLKMERMVIDLT